MRVSILIAALALASCSGGADETTEAQPETGAEAPAETPAETPPAETSEPEMPEAEPVKLTGKFCYFSKTETETEAMEVTFPEAGDITGIHYGVVHDEANAYFTAFDIDMTAGQYTSSGAVSFDTVYEVDGFTDSEKATWTFSEQTATSEVKTLTTAACEGLVERVHPPIE